jgi:FRG domain
MQKFHTTEIGTLSEFTHLLETRVSDKYRILLFRGQNIDKPLIPNISRHLFKKSREVDEKRMLEEFNIQAIQYLSYHPKNELEELTIAQHHGVPTRLLDWTENALAALYFAVSKEPIIDSNAVVWVLSLERDSPLLVSDPNINVFNQKQLKFFKPTSIIQRVSSQHGWFSLHPFRGQGFYDRVDEPSEAYRLNKIVIKHGCSKKILQTLESCGINRHTIFRDLDSLGYYIFEKYKFEKKD